MASSQDIDPEFLTKCHRNKTHFHCSHTTFSKPRITHLCPAPQPSHKSVRCGNMASKPKVVEVAGLCQRCRPFGLGVNKKGREFRLSFDGERPSGIEKDVNEDGNGEHEEKYEDEEVEQEEKGEKVDPHPSPETELQDAIENESYANITSSLHPTPREPRNMSVTACGPSSPNGKALVKKPSFLFGLMNRLGFAGNSLGTVEQVEGGGSDASGSWMEVEGSESYAIIGDGDWEVIFRETE